MDTTTAPTSPDAPTKPETPAEPQSAEPPEHHAVAEPIIRAQNLSIYYGDFHAVKQVTLDIAPRQVTAMIGPSGCGKSTLLRSLNRMNDFIGSFRIDGSVIYQGRNIYGPGVDPVELRRRVGMVFQKPNPFPKTIYANVAWGARINGYRGDMDELVERSLQQAALWDEVRDKLHKSALQLSGGQQQRLCIARAIAVRARGVANGRALLGAGPQIATARHRGAHGQAPAAAVHHRASSRTTCSRPRASRTRRRSSTSASWSK